MKKVTQNEMKERGRRNCHFIIMFKKTYQANNKKYEEWVGVNGIDFN
jgi:hypothetical protein